ncbi:MAG: hydrogenase formation protein HypD [Coriobacteriales bacterium]|nr:hydrogenase formation protein HypD [Coriobacteriales bacterium]
MNLDLFKDPKLARDLLNGIASLDIGEVNLMEVCGTHTAAIGKSGLRSVLPDNVHLLSGPGCPVCVTSNADIDTIIALAKIEGVTLATFGDMIRVPGSSTTLQECKAQGSDVQVVYSPLDALDLARRNPERQVVFVGVGFETTAPLVAVTIKRAYDEGIPNFSVICVHKNMPHALETLVKDPQVNLDALNLPGHVSTIIGSEPYEFLAHEYGIGGVVTGFETVDILQGIAMLLHQIASGEPKIEIAYVRGVAPEGNKVAMAMIDEVFEECESIWRGLGPIDRSGYRIRSKYAEFDALERFSPVVEETVEHAGCRCAEVLRGTMPPSKCPLFRKVCTPSNPVGPCMVSSEGSCSAYYKYQID